MIPVEISRLRAELDVQLNSAQMHMLWAKESHSEELSKSYSAKAKLELIQAKRLAADLVDALNNFYFQQF
jgi:hypothetical protein